ncbi:unnamed protein product [[Candida] boidinii]|uniref:Unnamed protein product n=1 Tax=Candida boidinii TaxID=5477 RepID=A0ACB5TXP5_CANBO|nr:unnamed protein product [[Candida] boidinii]GME97580.1 unnamed protein product [[Candida] boidinii]
MGVRFNLRVSDINGLFIKGINLGRRERNVSVWKQGCIFVYWIYSHRVKSFGYDMFQKVPMGMCMYLLEPIHNH